MIRSFGDKDTEALFGGHCAGKWRRIRPRAERKLAMLDAAPSLGFLAAAPGNRLEKMRGNRSGQYSIRINDRWRICFTWKVADAYDVEVVDYH